MVHVHTPTAERYADAFRSVAPLADAHLAMFRFQHAAPRQTVTSTQMARAARFRHYGVANLQFGRLGRRIGDLLDFHPTTMPIDVLVTQSKPAGEWLWTMRLQVAEALERLGWVAPTAFASPDEELGHPPLVEGAVYRASPSTPTSATRRPGVGASRRTAPCAPYVALALEPCTVRWPRVISTSTTCARFRRSVVSTLSIRSRTYGRCAPTVTQCCIGVSRHTALRRRGPFSAGVS